jgi:hypothetical protein
VLNASRRHCLALSVRAPLTIDEAHRRDSDFLRGQEALTAWNDERRHAAGDGSRN